MSEYKIVALDMDGTLLDDHKKIHPNVARALNRLQQQNIQVILVTGRHHSAVYPYILELGLTTPAICCNGSYLYNFKDKIFLNPRPMSQGKALSLFELVQNLGLHTLLYLDDLIIYQKIDQSLHRSMKWAKALPPELRPTMQQATDLVPFIQEAAAIWKFSVVFDDLTQLNFFAQQVSELLQLSTERSWANRIDVARLGNTKGHMLYQWVESQNLSLSQVIAFGDNENDISMLKIVGMGIAMGNSDPKVQTFATLTIGNNNSDTIAATLQQLFPD